MKALVTKENQFFLPENMPDGCAHRCSVEEFFGLFLRCAQAAGKTPFSYCQMECTEAHLCFSAYPKNPTEPF